MCKAFVIAANKECGKLLWRMKIVCKAFVIVANEECVQSFCYCGE